MLYCDFLSMYPTDSPSEFFFSAPLPFARCRFLEALHFFTIENVRWRALPERFGHWNSVWKRFDRLSKPGVFEAFFDTFASMSSTAHLIQMFGLEFRVFEDLLTDKRAVSVNHSVDEAHAIPRTIQISQSSRTSKR